jgi:hypothetical protein
VIVLALELVEVLVVDCPDCGVDVAASSIAIIVLLASVQFNNPACVSVYPVVWNSKLLALDLR